ncbi:hypothetical protein [Novosphingobium sp. CECT 9465]|uniref:hypothetical protein n=1 Tax=Novosphingobium sp. CECT 9465 TaxID=2829794 RepID=UPI001E36B038|nr:hypothetical protein [Novosphingobium sp. CECT 9465]CAH0497354.1 hypothetical protein NVSP9465_02413 [Novosphingobium sp. CECT 9465]
MQLSKTLAVCEQIEMRVTKRRNRAVASLCVGAALLYVSALIWTPWQSGLESRLVLISILAATFGSVCILLLGRAEQRRYQAFINQQKDIVAAIAATESKPLKTAIDCLTQAKSHSGDARAYLQIWAPMLDRHLNHLLDKEAKEEREARIAQLCRDADQLVKSAIRRQHEALPEIKAKMRLEEELPHLRRLVEEADNQFKSALGKRKLKWWLMLTRNRSALEEVERQILALETALEKLNASPTVIIAEEQYREFKAIVDRRVAQAKAAAIGTVPDSRNTPFEPDHALTVGLFAGVATGARSLVHDVIQAGSVFNSLREVNRNFDGMSDFEIWQEALAMPTDSLIGLASLTKGAYFEKLVEHDFGGERFANFNHPDTDIVIDGVAIQIKATDSVSYINSVEDHIPIIATSEVAQKTDAIDGGFSDEELSEAIDLALGGTVIDIGDAVLDGVASGIGGVGIVAILAGSHSAWKSYQSNGDAIAALGVGLQTTAVRTLRTAVNLFEIAYRGSAAVFTSKPTQFVTKTVQAGLKAAHNKMNDSSTGSTQANSLTPLSRPIEKSS